MSDAIDPVTFVAAATGTLETVAKTVDASKTRMLRFFAPYSLRLTLQTSRVSG